MALLVLTLRPQSDGATLAGGKPCRKRNSSILDLVPCALDLLQLKLVFASPLPMCNDVYMHATDTTQRYNIILTEKLESDAN